VDWIHGAQDWALWGLMNMVINFHIPSKTNFWCSGTTVSLSRRALPHGLKRCRRKLVLHCMKNTGLKGKGLIKGECH
jgi:hypothetical protein